MEPVRIEKPTDELLKNLGVETWSTWTSEVKTFPWSYDEEETCYFNEGRVKMTVDGKTYEFGKGDLVTFAKGVSCTWEVLEPVNKVYAFNVRDKG
jgi:uncharacterized cupin superfamily protein